MHCQGVGRYNWLIGYLEVPAIGFRFLGLQEFWFLISVRSSTERKVDHSEESSYFYICSWCLYIYSLNYIFSRNIIHFGCWLERSVVLCSCEVKEVDESNIETLI